ncbi:MAG: hypothetical protein PHC61_16995 [Chitinivibrionales bacterium]|nr:hypothetical protein [Chitinivibrionales bacterium]
MPLKNDVPKIALDPDSIIKTLIYPDSVLCTLQVSDKNDTALFIDSLWPGSARQIQNTYYDKSIILSLGGARLGEFSGMSSVNDSRGVGDTFYYAVSKLFTDNFNRNTLGKWWQLYTPEDSEYIKLKYRSQNDAVLQFIFPFDSSKLGATNRAGVYSTFSIFGDFSCTIEVTIFNGFYEGVETAFFVSTSRDTGQWAGDVAGIFISSGIAGMQLKCKSVNGQVSSKVSSVTEGTLGLRQTGDQMVYLYSPMGASRFDTLATFQYDVAETLCVHLRMIVKDTAQLRESYFDNFILSKVQLVY